MLLFQRVLGVLVALSFVAAVLVFASMLLLVLVPLGIAGWVWLWWRARSRDQGRIIEGEYRDETPLQAIEDREEQRL